MPSITKPIHIEITPEQFLVACSQSEIIELDLLLCSERYRRIIAKHYSQPLEIEGRKPKSKTK